MPRKTKRHSTEQIIAVLRAAETCGKPIQDSVREKGISEQTYYRWRSKYGGMDVNDSRRLKELEHENARLKKIIAEHVLEIDIMKEISRKKW